MKKLLLKKSLLLILYSLVYLYFMIFNWQVFTISLNINLGFGTATLPPFIILFFLGFTLIGILSWISYITSLQRMIYELEQGVQPGKMKDKLARAKIQELFAEKSTLEMLKTRLGIQELIKKQDEISILLEELRKDQKSDN